MNFSIFHCGKWFRREIFKKCTLRENHSVKNEKSRYNLKWFFFFSRVYWMSFHCSNQHGHTFKQHHQTTRRINAGSCVKDISSKFNYYYKLFVYFGIQKAHSQVSPRLDKKWRFRIIKKLEKSEDSPTRYNQ